MAGLGRQAGGADQRCTREQGSHGESPLQLEQPDRSSGTREAHVEDAGERREGVVGRWGVERHRDALGGE